MGRHSSKVLAFNDLTVRKAIKSSVGKPQQEWRVEGVRRLVLVTRPSGSAAFYINYPNARGVRRKLRLGEYDPKHFTLADARSQAQLRLAEIDQGADPVKDKKAAATAMTFRQLAEKCLKESTSIKASTKATYRYALEKDAFPAIGDVPAAEVSADQVIAICKAIEATGARVQSDRTKTAIGGVYRWGMRERLVKSNPTREIGRRAPIVARTRTPTDNELAILWDAVENGAGSLSRSVRLIIQLAMLTGQRRNEVAGARLSELHGLDGEAPAWIIPGDTNVRGKIAEGRTKNRREQRVPLSPQAAELFRRAVALTAENPHADGDHIFPADMGKVKKGKKAPRALHINGESVSKAMRRMRETVGVSDVGIHDMRRAVSNWLKDQGISREVRDLVLNHLDPSVDGRHYSQEARMERQVREALEAWAGHLWRVTGQAKLVDNVVQLRA